MPVLSRSVNTLRDANGTQTHEQVHDHVQFLVDKDRCVRGETARGPMPDYGFCLLVAACRARLFSALASTLCKRCAKDTYAAVHVREGPRHGGLLQFGCHHIIGACIACSVSAPVSPPAKNQVSRPTLAR